MARASWKGLLSNLALAAASFGVTLCLLEFVLVPRLLPLLPLKIHAGLPRGVRMLAQSSKAGTVPHDYVALLGDSYAQGAGDWLLTVNPVTNPPFHSAHLIHDALGRDVVTFGMSGAGSLRALATELPTTLEYLNQTALFETEDPDVIVFYFYEGNDLNDNVADLAQRFDPDYGRENVRDRAVFRSFIEEKVVGQSPTHLDTLAFDWRDNFLLTRFVWRVIEAITVREWPTPRGAVDFSIREVNRAWVGGETVALPDLLQAPALDLRPDEVDLALFVPEQALGYLVDRYPDSEIGVVYIPSPLASYRITSPEVTIQQQVEGELPERYSRSLLAARSDAICNGVYEIARSEGVGFVDLRPAIWRETEREFLHGPRDWKHLNRAGQHVLADAAVALIEAQGTTDAVRYFESCASFQNLLAAVPVAAE